MEQQIWVTVLATLFSGLLTFAISTYYYLRHERRKEKFVSFKNILANRQGLAPNGNPEAKARFLQELNASISVFYDSKPVINALHEFKLRPTRTADNVNQLIRCMAHDLHLDVSFIRDDFFNEPFV